MLNVKNNPFMLRVDLLNVVMLSVVAPSQQQSEPQNFFTTVINSISQ
jgi:hypothetical protein